MLEPADIADRAGIYAVPNVPDEPEPVETVEPASAKKAPARPARKGRAKKTSLGETLGTLLGTMAGGAMVLVSGKVASPIVGPEGAMTPAEAQSITRPLGNIAGRRAPKVILPGIPEADRADVEEILATLIEWIARCAVIAVARWGELQQARANAATVAPTSGPARERARPVNAPPPLAPTLDTAPIAPMPTRETSRDMGSTGNNGNGPGAPISTMGFAETLIQAGYAHGDRGETLIGG